MIPMGTVVTVCMFIGLILEIRPTFLARCPTLIRKTLGIIILAAGLWNVVWYGIQHLTEFWGLAALVSGVLMIITALYIVDESRLPKILQRSRPIVLVILLGCALMYAITIARL